MKEPVIFIDIPANRVQHKLFIYFFAGTIIKTPEPFVFLDVSKVPLCLDRSDLALQDSFLALDVRLGVSVLLFAFRPDMTQFSSIMADVIMLILKDGICHVGILPDVLFVYPCLPLLMVLKSDITLDLIPFQIQQVFLTAVAAVSSNCFQICFRIAVAAFPRRSS